jgi:hypothetical protein
MATKEPEIRIKVGDWANEYHEVEPHITGEDDLVTMVTQQKMNTAKAARVAIMAREFGNAPADILPGNKPLLNSGAAVAISSIVARRHTEVTLENGSTLTVREFVAPVRDEEEGQNRDDTHLDYADPSPLPETFEPVVSEISKGRALDYLFKIVPGYVYGRLKVIAVNGGDVKAAADELKVKIDEMVTRLG